MYSKIGKMEARDVPSLNSFANVRTVQYLEDKGLLAPSAYIDHELVPTGSVPGATAEHYQMLCMSGLLVPSWYIHTPVLAGAYGAFIFSIRLGISNFSNTTPPFPPSWKLPHRRLHTIHRAFTSTVCCRKIPSSFFRLSITLTVLFLILSIPTECGQ